VDEGTVRLSSKGESDRITQRSAVQIRPRNHGRHCRNAVAFALFLKHRGWVGRSCDRSKPKPFLTCCVLLSVVDRLGMLKVLIKVGVSALVLMLAALPVAACVSPGAAMTSAERECCKKMAEQCGDMGMAKSHPCCKVSATPGDFHALKTTASQLDHVSLVPFHALPLTAQTDEYISLAQCSSRVSCTHSPPGLESLATTVLRI
jgi:hypothetical protein